MSDWTCNGFPVVRAVVQAPLGGRWVADLEVDTGEAIAGAAALSIGGVAWIGTVLRGGVDAGDVWHGRVVGGARGLDRPVTARSWNGLQPGRGLITDLLAEVGETLSDASTAEVDANLSRWSRFDMPADRALADLARSLGCTWRVTTEGTVWVGVETWPELVLPEGVEAEALATDPRTGASVYSMPGAYVTPGSTFERRRVGGVVYRLDDGTDRAHVMFIDEVTT